jgi:hypothetical protein
VTGWGVALGCTFSLVVFVEGSGAQGGNFQENVLAWLEDEFLGHKRAALDSEIV